MGGEEDDKGPYRTPLDRPPPSGPKRSARVLSGLAQLRSAKGDVEESAALSERAALARASAPARQLTRCMDGLEALRRYDRRAARRAFAHWLETAADKTPRDEDRLEALSALATLSIGAQRESALIAAIPLALAGIDLPVDTPACTSIVLARTLRLLGVPERAEALLAGAHETDVFPYAAAAVSLERAQLAIERDELEEAGDTLRRVAMFRAHAYGESSAPYAECVTLAGKLFYLLGHVSEADSTLREALRILRQIKAEASAEAEAMAAHAMIAWERGRYDAAIEKAFSALQFVNADRNSPAMLPALSCVMRVFTAADRPTRALAIQQDIESIQALYGCGSP